MMSKAQPRAELVVSQIQAQLLKLLAESTAQEAGSVWASVNPEASVPWPTRGFGTRDS